MGSPKHIVVLGAGPGGEAAAKRALSRGARVTLIEKDLLGGLCLNRGCVPSKILLEAGRTLHAARHSGMVSAEALGVSWEKIRAQKDTTVTALRGALSQNYARLGITVKEGRASFLDAQTLEVERPDGRERLTFDAAVLATGSEPVFPSPFDSLRTRILDSDRALSLPSLPKRMVVVGGGAVGCEFACLFHELGVSVTLVEKTGGLLPGEDPAVVRVLERSFEARGIRLNVNTTVQTARMEGGAWTLGLSNGETLLTEEVLVCVGRRPVLAGLGLEKAGIQEDRGRVKVDDFLRTSHPAVYAVGDINGRSLLAHAASAQADVAVDHVWGEAVPYRNDLVPRCLYTWPEVASVGEWASSAQAKGVETKAQRFFFKGSPKALASGETEGFIQVVSDKNNERLLGAQIVGPHATELIHIFSVALSGNLTTAQLRRVVFAHPTLSEGVREALSR